MSPDAESVEWWPVRSDAAVREPDRATLQGNGRFWWVRSSPHPSCVARFAVSCAPCRTEGRIRRTLLKPALCLVSHQFECLERRNSENGPPTPAVGKAGMQRLWSRTLAADRCVWLRCPTMKGFRPVPLRGRPALKFSGGSGPHARKQSNRLSARLSTDA